MTSFGTRVHERRVELGITQTQLAAAVGVSASHVYAIEAGRNNVSLPLAMAIASKLDVTLDWLTQGADR